MKNEEKNETKTEETEVQTKRRNLTTLAKVRFEVSRRIEAMSLQLFNGYIDSDEHKEDIENETVPSINTFNAQAQTRVENDLRMATIILAMEGAIPPKNVFHGADEVARLAASLSGDQRAVKLVMTGKGALCIHGDDAPNDTQDKVDQLKGMLFQLKNLSQHE